ncbi:hypothetical protein [Caballeronia sp. LZ034LL]|uniref:hypothetical protein n=1 Tax=Caballeronia sp. LZ034LL TaxID=3038567 RepID=UPI002863336C|nr:hypothetical protein [Caballeronia sp. LZ034LL]MDR5839359.1 hypothetical protein [Caballeronia sp. LZ034LL]
MSQEKKSPTGRVTPSEPNLQNILIRTPEGTAIRRALIEDYDKFNAYWIKKLLETWSR